VDLTELIYSQQRDMTYTASSCEASREGSSGEDSDAKEDSSDTWQAGPNDERESNDACSQDGVDGIDHGDDTLEIGHSMLEEHSDMAQEDGSNKIQAGSSRPLILKEEIHGREAWMHRLKHFFILTNSGKPIFSYNEAEEGDLASLTALITALVSVVQDQVYFLMEKVACDVIS
jgi:hypothetical protein